MVQLRRDPSVTGGSHRGITQFYLPPTHELFLVCTPSLRASPPLAGTHCAYPRRDGQAELTWVAGYIPG